MPGLIYSKQGNTLFVNLYASNDAEVSLKDHKVDLSQETTYPWDGKVKLTVKPEEAGEFTIKLRIPGWARNEVLPGDLYHYASQMDENNVVSVNGETVEAAEEDGYFAITRTWESGDVVTLDFPMEVRKVIANPLVEEDKGKMSLEYGPIVYAIEEVDNKNNFEQIGLTSDEQFNVQMNDDLLGGVNTVSNEEMTAIPYYVWSNRGIGKMKVWLPTKED
jgi:hypothetical protein